MIGAESVSVPLRNDRQTGRGVKAANADGTRALFYCALLRADAQDLGLSGLLQAQILSLGMP
jgi:hypothetical protein